MKKQFILVTILWVIFSLLSAAGTVKKDPQSKLAGPLKDVVKFYRLRPMLAGGVDSVQGAARVTRNRFTSLADVLVDPKVQKRWKNPRFDVLTCLIKISGETDVLKDRNLKIRTVSNLGTEKIVSVEIGALEIEKVAALPQVISITPITKKMLTNDKAAFETGAAALRLKEDGVFTKGYTGKGVIVGIVDTGVDPYHPDLSNENGSRILYYWDPYVERPGTSPAQRFGGVLSGLDFGTVWTKAEIDAGLCTSVDDYAHGTHVTGIAAGQGNVVEEYAGMAPNADLIIVKEDETNNGMLFVYELAKRLEKPCVVNLGYTMYMNLHMMAMYPGMLPGDGTSDFSLQIKGWNDSYGPGAIPVKSAGNYGHWPSYTNSAEFPYKTGGYHSEAPLSASSVHQLEVPDYGEVWAEYGLAPTDYDYPIVHVGMWYESPVQVTFISPNGLVAGPMIHGVSGTVPAAGGSDGAVTYVMDNPAAVNGHYYATFELGDLNGPRFYPEPGEWQVLVEPVGGGSGSVDLWCAEAEWYFGYWYPVYYQLHPGVIFTNGSHSKYILDEAVSPYVLSVGGYVTKDRWIGTDGLEHGFPEGYIIGAVIGKSSPGPARNGTIKPDVAAPATVVSCLASDSSPLDPFYFLEGEQYVMFNGTSAAAPVVVGGVALILEKYPDKTFAEVKRLIRTHAVHDSFTAEYGPNAFGHGKFNISFLNDKPVAAVTAEKIDGKIVFDASASYDPEQFPLTYTFKVETRKVCHGHKPKNYTVQQDGARLILSPDTAVDGYYRVKLRVNDSITNSKKVHSDWVFIRN